MLVVAKPKTLGYILSMSKKTIQIYTSLENLFEIQQKFLEIKSNLQMEKITTESENSLREMDELTFNMEQNLKNLKFWVTSLYEQNGKSKSAAKKIASQQNGKKGGRPPKKITQAKQTLSKIEIRLADIDHNLKMNDNIEEIEQLQNEREILLQNQKIFQQILLSRKN